MYICQHKNILEVFLSIPSFSHFNPSFVTIHAMSAYKNWSNLKDFVSIHVFGIMCVKSIALFDNSNKTKVCQSLTFNEMYFKFLTDFCNLTALNYFHKVLLKGPICISNHQPLFNVTMISKIY